MDFRNLESLFSNLVLIQDHTFFNLSDVFINEIWTYKTGKENCSRYLMEIKLYCDKII